jgi:hypothetical protein
MTAAVIPLEAVLRIAREHPESRAKNFAIRLIHQEKTDGLWIWWMERELGRIIDAELAREFQLTGGMV